MKISAKLKHLANSSPSPVIRNMTKNERLVFCKICTRRKMDIKRGLICSLTNSEADFELECLDFEKDQQEKDRLLNIELASVGHENVGDALDAKKNKERGSWILVIGILITLISHSISASIGFFIITYGAIIYGARQYMKGVKQEKILQKEIAQDEENDGSLKEDRSDSK